MIDGVWEAVTRRVLEPCGQLREIAEKGCVCVMWRCDGQIGTGRMEFTDL